MFFIGDVRRLLLISGSHKWNGWVRQSTAWLEMHAKWLVRSQP